MFNISHISVTNPWSVSPWPFSLHWVTLTQIYHLSSFIMIHCQPDLAWLWAGPYFTCKTLLHKAVKYARKCPFLCRWFKFFYFQFEQEPCQLLAHSSNNRNRQTNFHIQNLNLNFTLLFFYCKKLTYWPVNLMLTTGLDIKFYLIRRLTYDS